MPRVWALTLRSALRQLLPKLAQTLISGRVLDPLRITDPNLIKVMGLSLKKYTCKHMKMCIIL